MKKIKDSKDWFGIKGARLIDHGNWSDGEVVYQGCSYNLYELTEDMWNQYESFCEDEGIEATEEGFDDWEGLEQAAENALYDLYPTEVVEIEEPETFKVKITSLQIDLEDVEEDNEGGYDLDELRNFPFNEGDEINISELKEWFQNSTFYDFGVTSDGGEMIEITANTDSYIDVLTMTVENAMGEYWPNAGNAMENYLS